MPSPPSTSQRIFVATRKAKGKKRGRKLKRRHKDKGDPGRRNDGDAWDR